MNPIKPSLKIPTGVLNAVEAMALFAHAREHQYALPAVNVIGTSSVNAVLEAAKTVNSAVIIQLSKGGAEFFIGKGTSLSGHEPAIAGGIAAAHYIHIAAKTYGVPVILHTDHASKKLLPWIDGLLAAGQAYFAQHQRPLFTSHMLDLSEEPLEENVGISADYFSQFVTLDMGIEIELGCTGGEEDGVDNSDMDQSLLYTRPDEVLFAYERLFEISSHFSIAASFGNVHGVYKPGNVVLTPEILRDAQALLNQHRNIRGNQINFVFHGGSGSEPTKITEAIGYGVVKMNIDTDTQWAMWEGVSQYRAEHADYLNSQLGNPEGPDRPNKKYYDPRVWLRHGEAAMVKRLKQCFIDLNCVNRLAGMNVCND